MRTILTAFFGLLLSPLASAHCPDLGGTYMCVYGGGEPEKTYVSQSRDKAGVTTYVVDIAGHQETVIADGVTRSVDSESLRNTALTAQCVDHILLAELEGEIWDAQQKLGTLSLVAEFDTDENGNMTQIVEGELHMDDNGKLPINEAAVCERVN